MNVLLYSKTYHQTGTIPYLTVSFDKFENFDNTNSYDVYFDSTKTLNEYIGLAMVYKEYDIEGRTIKRIGLNLKGGYYLWDYSPIIHTSYSGDTTIVDYFNYEYLLKDRVNTIKDSLGREVETLEYDHNLKLIIRTVKTYDDSLNELLIIYYDGNGDYKPDELGVSIRMKKFDPNNQTTYLKEYFYDSKMNLIDGDHNNLSSSNESKLNYSQIKRNKKEGEWLATYYNSKGKVICEENFAGITIITTTKK